MKKTGLILVVVILSAAVMLTGMGVFSAAEKTAVQTAGRADEYINGDTDGDGAVTIMDATAIQRILAHLSHDADGKYSLRGDVNKDGLNIMDATAIQRHLARYQDKFKVGVTMRYPQAPTEVQPTRDPDELPEIVF